ncbi:hypothetical protein AKJ16_DCAP25544 [Drosera capensis]
MIHQQKLELKRWGEDLVAELGGVGSRSGSKQLIDTLGKAIWCLGSDPILSLLEEPVQRSLPRKRDYMSSTHLGRHGTALWLYSGAMSSEVHDLLGLVGCEVVEHQDLAAVEDGHLRVGACRWSMCFVEAAEASFLWKQIHRSLVDAGGGCWLT